MNFERKSDTPGLLDGRRFRLGRRIDARRFGRFGRFCDRHRDGDQDACRIGLGFFDETFEELEGLLLMNYSTQAFRL